MIRFMLQPGTRKFRGITLQVSLHHDNITHKKREERINHRYLSRPYQLRIRHRHPIGNLLQQLIHISRIS